MAPAVTRSPAMSLGQLGLVLLLSLGLEATPQNFPGMSQSTADWYIRRFNKMEPDEDLTPYSQYVF